TKGEAIVDVFIKVIRDNHATKRVIGASFHLSNLKSLRKKAPEILTSITTEEVRVFLLLQKIGLLPAFPFKKRLIIFQVPVGQGFIKVITPRFVKTMHKRGAIIQVWTINEEKEMRWLFELGVDAVMTDKPALAFQVAQDMGIQIKN
ncbi:MAG: glycerophosphodiester phosphodiesterase family protein, partial [Sphaerochaeta sp.]